MVQQRATVRGLVAAALMLAAGCSNVSQDLGGASGVVSSLLSNAATAAIVNAPDPITTSFADTHQDTTLPAGFGDDQTPLPLQQQPRDPTGAYLLAPGFYEMTARSYCLHAGSQGPSQGDGYLYAPMAGSATDVIEALIRNSDAKPDVPQTSVQELIWAVLARAKFDSLPNDLKVTAAELLTPQQLLELNGGALGLVPDSVISQAVSSLPQPVQQAVAAANKLRSLFSQASVAYADLEAAAVLPPGPTPANYPAGGWSKLPAGDFVRYFPINYTTTRVQVYVPPPSAGAADPPTPYDGPGEVADPADTNAQRLAQSNSPVTSGSGGPPPPPPPPPPPTPSIQMLLLNGFTPDFSGHVPTRIQDPDLSPDNSLAANFVLVNDDLDLLGVDPYPRGRALQSSYCYSLMVIAKVTFPAGSTPPPPAQVACNWNRVFQERVVAISKAGNPAHWTVTSLSPSLNVDNGFPTPVSDISTVPNTIPSFTSTLSPHYITYGYDNPGVLTSWTNTLHLGDYLLLENDFTYTLQVTGPQSSASSSPFHVGQVLVLKRTASGATPVKNVVSTAAIPDCQMPNDQAHVDYIRAIVGGTIPIVIDPHANDPWPP